MPSPADLPDPGTELGSPALQADSLPSEPPGKPGILIVIVLNLYIHPGNVIILAILSVLIHEHRQTFHLFTLSLIYFKCFIISV